MIGISTSVLNQELPKAITKQRYHLSMDYIKSVSMAGGLPVMLPVLAAKDAEAVVANLSGVIISGGNDVSAIFSEKSIEKLPSQEENPDLSTGLARDYYEIALVQAALKQKKPFLGICRGLQVLNVALGGTLYQEINKGRPFNHIQLGKKPQESSHEVSLVKDSFLYEIFGKENLAVNSYHHQAIRKVGNDLKVSAISNDGWIEGLDYLGDSFTFGVQWHPEIMAPSNPEMLKLFQYFVSKTKK